MLADISHYTKVVSGISSEMRCLNVVIPAVMDDNRTNLRDDDDVEIILLVEEGVPPLPMTIKVDAGNNGNVENRPPLPLPLSSLSSSSSLLSLGDGGFTMTTSFKE